MSLDLSTEGLARASSKRPWRAVALWVALSVVAIGINGTLLEDALTTEFGFTNNPDSWKAEKLLEDRLRGPKKITEMVIVQSPTLTVDDEAFKARVGTLYPEILALEVQKPTHNTKTGVFRWPGSPAAKRRSVPCSGFAAGTSPRRSLGRMPRCS